MEPPPDRLAVRGGPQLSLGSVRLLLPGRHTVRAEKAGYRPLEAPLEVTRDPRQIARFALERLPGLLDLERHPRERRPGQRGRHAQRARPRSRRSRSPRASTRSCSRPRASRPSPRGSRSPGAARRSTCRPPSSPIARRVSFASDPPGAQVRVDGAARGDDAPHRGPDVRRPPGRGGARRIPSRNRAASRWRWTCPCACPCSSLEPLPGRLAVTSEPAGAAVSVGGRFRGETPIELELPAGVPHAVRLTKAGHRPAEATVTLARGETQPLALTLAAEQGEVQIAVRAPRRRPARGRPAARQGGADPAPHRGPARDRAAPRGVRAPPRHRDPAPRLPPAGARPPAQREGGAGRGHARRSCALPPGHELRLLRGGRFQMGASRREPGRRANETLREVELQRPFYLAAREVTNAQFRKLEARPHLRPLRRPRPRAARPTRW